MKLVSSSAPNMCLVLVQTPELKSSLINYALRFIHYLTYLIPDTGNGNNLFVPNNLNCGSSHQTMILRSSILIDEMNYFKFSNQL